MDSSFYPNKVDLCIQGRVTMMISALTSQINTHVLSWPQQTSFCSQNANRAFSYCQHIVLIDLGQLVRCLLFRLKKERKNSNKMHFIWKQLIRSCIQYFKRCHFSEEWESVWDALCFLSHPFCTFKIGIFECAKKHFKWVSFYFVIKQGL